MTAILDFHVEKVKPAHLQVYDHVSALIDSGEYADARRLPPTSELAASLGSHVATVHRAMAMLVAEGRLERRPRHGTFVKSSIRRLTRAAIYTTREHMIEPSHRFSRALHSALLEELEAAAVTCRPCMDPRPEFEHALPFAALVEETRNRQVDAVFCLTADMKHRGWMEKLDVPVVFATMGKIANAVGFDFQQFGTASIESAARQGCRSIGLISPMVCGYSSAEEQFGDLFYAAAAKAGLRVEEAWIPRGGHDDMLADTEHAHYGYEHFMRLWNLPDRPDALVVHPDSIACGVIAAILARRVHVPQELKLILHKNEEVELLCPMPATFLVSSARETAKALHALAADRVAGKAVQPLLLPFRVCEWDGGERVFEK